MTEQTATQIQLLTDRAEVIRVVDEIDNTITTKDGTHNEEKERHDAAERR